MDLKRRLEKLENSRKHTRRHTRNENFTLHDQNGELVNGKIVKMPGKDETGIAIIEGKERPIAVDISITEYLCLCLPLPQLEELIGFKFTPDTVFMRKNNILGGMEFLIRVCEWYDDDENP